MLIPLFNVFIDNTPFWLYIIHQAYEILYKVEIKIRFLIAVSTLIFTNEFAIGYIYIYIYIYIYVYIYCIYIYIYVCVYIYVYIYIYIYFNQRYILSILSFTCHVDLSSVKKYRLLIIGQIIGLSINFLSSN